MLKQKKKLSKVGLTAFNKLYAFKYYIKKNKHLLLLLLLKLFHFNINK